jgi:hypothetical protein
MAVFDNFAQLISNSYEEQSVYGGFIYFFFLVQNLLCSNKRKLPNLVKQTMQTVTYLQAHISYLANDKREGRSAGTNRAKELAVELHQQKVPGRRLATKGSEGFYSTI